jgi:methyltransferase (TIGR00027 family)
MSRPEKSRFQYIVLVFGLAPVLFIGIYYAIYGSGGMEIGRDRPSRTAEGVAALRAMACFEPDEKYRNPDYLAGKFISRDFEDSARWWYDPQHADIVLERLHERGAVGYFYLNARTKHIDATLKKEASRGIKQVVVLGSGYDSRAYRFGKSLPGVKFFEVDLPATISEKQKRVKKIFGKLPENTFYAPIDFNVDTIENVLVKAGYNPSLVSFFIWEGVSMYISKEAVNSTLQFIAKKSGPGSSVIFDYIHRDVIDGEFERHYGAERMAERVEDVGEPFTFGMAKDEAELIVKKNGLKVKWDIGKKEMETIYLVTSRGEVRGPAPTFFRIMHAGK